MTTYFIIAFIVFIVNTLLTMNSPKANEVVWDLPNTLIYTLTCMVIGLCWPALFVMLIIVAVKFIVQLTK